MKQLAKRGIVICVIVALVYLTALLSGCFGYNKLMRKYLSNPDNYYEVKIEITRIYTLDLDKNGKEYDNRYTDIVSPSDIDFASADIFYIAGKVLSGNVSFWDDEDYEKQYEISFEISEANMLCLLSTDFFDTVTVGDCINVRSTFWTYWDRKWNYVAEISLNGITYLQFDTGLKNIIDYMNENKSLF